MRRTSHLSLVSRPHEITLTEGDYEITYPEDEPAKGLFDLNVAVRRGLIPTPVAIELGKDVISIAKSKGQMVDLRKPDWLKPTLTERCKAVVRWIIGVN